MQNLDITEQLKNLREVGQEIITPQYYISFNPYSDSFFLDVPDHKKSIVLKALELDDEFVWVCDGVYPVEVQFTGDYNKVWKEFEPFMNGACVNLIPTNFEKEGKEYIWFEDPENGYSPICRDEIKIIE